MATDVTQIIPIPVDILQQIAAMLRKTWIPKIERGTIYISLAGWKQVNFAEAFKQVPTVGALILAKPAWYVEELFPPPNIDFSDLKKLINDLISKIGEIPELSIDIPTIPRPELEVAFADAFSEFGEDFWDKVETYIFKDLIAVPDKAIAEVDPVFRYLGASLARIIEKKLWDDKIQPQLDKIENELEPAINNVLKKFRDKVNDVISKIKNALTKGCDKAVADIEKATNLLTTYTSDALNKSIDKLWNMTGMEEGIIPSFAAVDNVTQTGFKVLAPSICTIHWWAFGEFIVPGEPIASRIETIIQQYTP